MFDLKKVTYKNVKKTVAWCKICDTEIRGNGSMLSPYYCKCGKYDCKYGERIYKIVKK